VPYLQEPLYQQLHDKVYYELAGKNFGRRDGQGELKEE
jgi:hypothetical protein